MDIEQVKQNCELILGKCYEYLRIDSCIMPVVFSVSDEEIEPHPFMIKSDEDRKALPVFLEKLSKKEGTDYLIAVFDMLSAPNSDNLPESLEGYEKSRNSIVLFLYSRDATHIRDIMYVKSENNNYNFIDIGWHVTELEGRLSNPFLKRLDS